MSNAVPHGWSVQLLGKLADVRSSNVDKKSDASELPVRLCNYTDVYYRNRITSDIDFMHATAKQGEIDRFALEKGDVIITKDSETPDDIAVPALVSESLPGVICGYHLTLLRPKPDRSNGEFLAHLFQLQSVQHYFYLLANGTTRFGLTAEAINTAPLITPPLPEQQKIATILSSVDNVIEKTRTQIDKLKHLKTGMMQELLTKGIGHTEFKDSPVGQVPEGWQLLSMRDICSVRQGLQIPISERHSKPSNNRWVYLTIRYINTGFDKSVAEYIENPKSSVVCTEDDIILARTGATGKVVTGINGVFHNNFFMVDYDRVKTVKNFLVQYLNSPFVQHEISNRAGTTTIPDLNHGDFYTIPMILPPVAEQLKLAEVLESLDILISNKISKYAAMEKAKKALMQDLLTGKVRVKPNKSAAL